jgi:hypothetical protein
MHKEVRMGDPGAKREMDCIAWQEACLGNGDRGNESWLL